MRTSKFAIAAILVILCAGYISESSAVLILPTPSRNPRLSVYLIAEIEPGGLITAFAPSPDGRMVAIAHASDLFEAGSIQLYRLSSTLVPIGTPLTGHTGAINDLQFSWDGQYLVSCSDDGSILIWDVEAGDLLGVLGPALANEAETPVNRAAISPDGKYVISSNVDSEGTSQAWSVTDETVIEHLTGYYPGYLYSLTFSPNGSVVAASGPWSSALLWQFSLSNEAPEFTGMSTLDDSWRLNSAVTLLRGHTAAIRMVRFSPDGTLLASASDDGTVRLWNVADGQAVSVLAGHSHAVMQIAWSPRGRWLVSGSLDGTVRVWDSISGHELLSLSDLPIRRGPLLWPAIDSTETRLIIATIDLIQVWRIAESGR